MKYILILAILTSISLGQLTNNQPNNSGSVIPPNIMPPLPPRPDQASDARVRAMVLELRAARMEAARMAARWEQRFIVVRVATNSSGGSTNFVMVLLPITPDETNSATAWGHNNAKTVTLVTVRPTGKGEEVIFFPEPRPLP